MESRNRKKKGKIKKQLFLTWFSTKDNNDEVQYKMEQAKIRRMVTNQRKRALNLENLLQIYVHQIVVRAILT